MLVYLFVDLGCLGCILFVFFCLLAIYLCFLVLILVGLDTCFILICVFGCFVDYGWVVVRYIMVGICVWMQLFGWFVWLCLCGWYCGRLICLVSFRLWLFWLVFCYCLRFSLCLFAVWCSLGCLFLLFVFVYVAWGLGWCLWLWLGGFLLKIWRIGDVWGWYKT